ncbi:tetratricopeptide repeat protein [Agaribacter flavus]|uniref:Tetratricopeptide repeat protein n=1 Tax=Agaribacter flavus TaxID=1902781 RepID=A0ABV7FP50_9ALTE
MNKCNTFLASTILGGLLSGLFSFSGVVTISALVTYSSELHAQEENTVKTRRVPTLRAKVYEQLSRAQTASDAGNTEEAIAILDEVKSKASSMNAYEIATMYNFYGFIYYNEERFDDTIASFEKAIEQSPIPVGFEQTALYSLAQLNMAQGNFEKVVEYLERWESLNSGTIPPKNFVLKAQALYQGKKYEEAKTYIEQAIAGHENEGYLPDENWLVLQRAIYFELKQPEKVKDIIAKLIRLYDEPKYWVQLAGMYGELEQPEKQLATMEIAYQRGFISNANDTFNLAQLYYFNGVPYKGAALMEQAIKDNILDENLRNLRFLAQAWQAAKENEKAVPVYAKAADLSDDGVLDAQLALIYFNSDQYDKAIASATKALEKGDLRSPGNTYLVLGLSLYNQRKFAEALDTLAKAEQYPATRASSRQWQQYVEKEKTNFEILQSMEAAP